MENNTVPRQRLKCSIFSVRKLKVGPHKKNYSETIPWSKDGKIVDFHLRNIEEASSDGEFIESAPIRKSENEKEQLDQKKSDLCLEESSYIKWEMKSFRNVGKAFDSNVMDSCAIKKETNDVCEELLLSCTHESSIKTEIIEHDEVHIKHEESNENRLNEKILEPRKQTVIHQCPDCPYSTNRKCHLKAHSIKHKKGDELDWYSCKECPYKTYRKWDLMRHTETHNSILLKCSKCCYETLRSSELKKHKTEHDPNIQWLHCPECSFKTHLRSYLQRHLLVHKSEANCAYQSRTERQLVIHQVKHEGMDKWHSCPVCPFKSYTKNILKEHCLRRHSIDLNKANQIITIKCPECPYESRYKRNVKLHQLIHNPSSWLQCSECTYKTPHKYIFERHKVRHQGENAEGWHRCLECSYKTPHRYGLRKHVIVHKSADEIEWFECSQCSFKTAYKVSLRLHQVQHKEAHEIEWFYCYQCLFKTIRKSHLVTHILSKHKKTN